MSERPERTSEADAALMGRALEVAQRGWGTTHPNPMVGALIVEAGNVVAEGWHERAGEAHAEVAALRNLGRAPQPGATLYVTLEPCSTRGRTGACVDAILAAGIRHVVVAADDPNPKHAGRAYEILRECGVEVRSGVLADEANRINPIFNFWITQGKPFFAAKVALTLDGKMATRSGSSRWITGLAARRDVMGWRSLFPAIVVGSGTIVADDPSLTIRDDDGGILSCPHRYVLCRSLERLSEMTLSYQVFNDDFREKTTIVTRSTDTPAGKRLQAMGIRCAGISADDSRTFLSGFREVLAGDGMTGALFEPGPTLFASLLETRMVDYGIFYIAPKLIADAHALGINSGWAPKEMADALALRDPRTTLFHPDVRIDGHFDYPGAQR